MAVAGHPFDDSLLEHAERCWKAECENAERITKERHLALTILAAILGFGFFKIEWLKGMITRIDLTPAWSKAVAVVIGIFLVGALVYFVWALFSLAHKAERQTASSHLNLPARAYYPPGVNDAETQRRMAFARTYRAYQELQIRNAKARKSLSSAWTRFGFGISLVCVVIVIYIIAQTVSIIVK